jgi:signal transduction histidine kinase
MSQTPLEFLNIFVRSPGDVIYFLVAATICQAGLLMAVGERWRSPQSLDARRYTLAMFGMVIAWIVIMLAALYSIVTGQPIAAILPPLERAAYVIIILLAGWAFLTRDRQRFSNTIVLILSILVIVGYVLTGIQWLNSRTYTAFNLTTYNAAWSLATLVCAIGGLILTLANFRTIRDAPVKLLFFALLSIGHGVTLLQLSQFNLLGNYAGPTRFAQLIALTILPITIYRMVLNNLQSVLASAPAQKAIASAMPKVSESGTVAPAVLPSPVGMPGISPAQRDSVQLLKTLGLILEDTAPPDIPLKVVTSVLEVVRADVGAILSLQDANYADITAAYDHAQRRSISGMALNLDNQPTLVNAIERRLQRTLYPDRNIDELRDLFTRLDIEDIGPAYFQPLMSGKQLVAVLVVGLPYIKKDLGETERELLKGIGIIAGNLLALSYAARDARLQAEERAIQAMVQGLPIDEITDSTILAARQETQASLQAAREQIAELTRQVSLLKIELDSERSRVVSSLGDTEEGLSVSQRILALTDEQQKLREEREQLLARLKEAETTLSSVTATGNESIYKTMIDALRREKEELLAQRQSLQGELAQLRSAVQPFATQQSIQDILDRIGEEKTRMIAERDELQNKLTDLSNQLKALGVEEGEAGLAQIIRQLSEQKSVLQAKLDSALLERNALVNEHKQHEGAILHEKERSGRIQALETEIHNLASDREALTKQLNQVRTERDELLAKQDAIKQNRARLLAEASGYQLELAEAHQEQAKLRVQLQLVADEKSELVKTQNGLLAEKQALETELNLLRARLDGDRDRLQQLGDDGVGSLTKMIEEMSEQRSQLEQELNRTQTQLADAQDRINMLQIRANSIPEAEANGTPAFQKYDPDITLSVAQELRTPITSIMGYIDLLMDESAGILGEMQRKFLKRVAANVNRLTSLLDDLTRITALDTSRHILVPQPVDLVGLIEDTISDSTYQFREKGLTVHLNLADNLPAVRADREAMSQVINQLLSNAYLVSPPDSSIVVTAHQQELQLSSGKNLLTPTACILISIEDRGGGIPEEEIARVFARKYKAENPLIPGLGDTGVGLSIAKTLVESHGGSLWVETRLGIGSIFYVALPLKTSLEAEVKEN